MAAHLITTAELAILGLLVERPRHGYEIDQVITERGMREWTDLGFSSIYYVLGRLEKAGLVTANAAPAAGRGPSRRVHTVTPAGLDAWRMATLAALSTPVAVGRPFLLGIAGLAGISSDEATDALSAYAAALEVRRGELAARRTAQAPLPWFVDALFDHGVAMITAEHAWVTGFIERVPTDSRFPAPDTGGRLMPPTATAPSSEAASAPAPAPARMKPFVPQIATLPARTMAVVRTVGDPAETGGRAFPALYGAVYGLKFALKKEGIAFAVEAPCARWFNGPDWRAVPRSEWTAAWALPVPDGTTAVTQKDPATPVVIETWDYGTVAQVLHIGTYAEEEPTIEKLHAFIAEQGLEIAGPHEEVYLSRPGAANQKTIVRYQVRRPG
jgi:DNA-binding PadR family transcriptional regulator